MKNKARSYKIRKEPKAVVRDYRKYEKLIVIVTSDEKDCVNLAAALARKSASQYIKDNIRLSDIEVEYIDQVRVFRERMKNVIGAC